MKASTKKISENGEAGKFNVSMLELGFGFAIKAMTVSVSSVLNSTEYTTARPLFAFLHRSIRVKCKKTIVSFPN